MITQKNDAANRHYKADGIHNKRHFSEMIELIMSSIARYDFRKGNNPRFKNAHYEQEYCRQYAASAIFEHLSEISEAKNGY